MTYVAFRVHDNPAPQGSKRHVGGGRMIESSKQLPQWRQSVIAAAVVAQQQYGAVRIDCPCEVTLTFYLPRPVSAPKRQVWPSKKPDLDKLIRSILDALTIAQIVKDDALVVSISAGKVYATPEQGAGVHVRVEVL